MGSLMLAAGDVVYVDTQVLIYSVEQRGAWETALQPLWIAYQEGVVEVVTSELSLLEVLVHPLRQADEQLEIAYREALSGGLARTLPIRSETLDRAARLRASHPTLRTPDAIHAAAALLANCDRFLSNDQGFRQVPGLPLVALDDLVAGDSGPDA